MKCVKNKVTVTFYFKIVRPISAFLIIDVQNDFVTGSLATKNGPAGEDGAEVVDPINQVFLHNRKKHNITPIIFNKNF